MSLMHKIKICPDEVKAMGINQWPTWEKEPSTFPWSYSEKETTYILEGDVTVASSDGYSISFGPGKLVTFEAGIDCIWEVKTALKKHYKFG